MPVPEPLAWENWPVPPTTVHRSVPCSTPVVPTGVATWSQWIGGLSPVGGVNVSVRVSVSGTAPGALVTTTAPRYDTAPWALSVPVPLRLKVPGPVAFTVPATTPTNGTATGRLGGAALAAPASVPTRPNDSSPHTARSRLACLRAPTLRATTRSSVADASIAAPPWDLRHADRAVPPKVRRAPTA